MYDSLFILFVGSWIAVAAGAELRCRHPGQQHPLLRSAELRAATQGQQDELTMTAGEEIPELGLMTPAEDPYYEDLGYWNASRAAISTWKPPNDGTLTWLFDHLATMPHRAIGMAKS